jgi:hypothetical protein
MLNLLVSFSILIAQEPIHRAEPESASPLLSGPFVLGLVLGIIIGALAALVFKMSKNKGERAQNFVPPDNPRPSKPAEQAPKSAGQQIRHCPKCNSTYTDESLLYCVSDGTALVAAGGKAQPTDPNATVLYPQPRRTD